MICEENCRLEPFCSSSELAICKRFRLSLRGETSAIDCKLIDELVHFGLLREIIVMKVLRL